MKTYETKFLKSRSNRMIWLLMTLLTVSADISNAVFEKLFVIVLENESLNHVMNDWYMGKELVSRGRLLTNYRGVAHPSQPNYIAMIAGSTYGIWNDRYHDLNGPTIVDLLEEKNLSWKTYHEDYPGDCFVGATYRRYVRKHNPFISFVNISTNPERCSNIVNSDELVVDIYHNRTSNFVLYVPNMDNNGHDTNYTYSSKWLQTFLNPILDHPHMASTLVKLYVFTL